MSSPCLDFDRVIGFVREHMAMPVSEGMRAIGWEVNGRLVAGVIVEGFNGRNVLLHIAGTPGGHWLTRGLLSAVFRYVFLGLCATRATVYVQGSNTASLRLARSLGFRQEATLEGAASDGSDLVISVMWRDQCRFLRARYGQE